MLLYEMTENGEPCDDWPAINYRLDTFGHIAVRILKPHELPQGYRIADGSRPKISGIRWAAKPGPVARESEQQWVPMGKSPGPTKITYSICQDGQHLHLEERLVDGQRTAQLAGVTPCRTNHKEHITRIGIRLEHLPETARQIVAQNNPSLIQRVRYFLGLS